MYDQYGPSLVALDTATCGRALQTMNRPDDMS